MIDALQEDYNGVLNAFALLAPDHMGCIMRDDWRPDLIRVLDEKGFSQHEFNVLQTLSYESCLTKDLVNRTVKESREAASKGVYVYSSRRACHRAIERLLNRELICLFDKSAIKRAVDHLEQFPAYGPLEGLPNRGFIDLTLAGASLWECLEKRVWPGLRPLYHMEILTDYTLTVRCCARSMPEVLEDLEHSNTEGAYPPNRRLLYIDGPRRVGPWRTRWWRTATSRGYLVDAMCQIDQ